MAGKNGSTWRHDWVPTNLAAAILKHHGARSGSGRAPRSTLNSGHRQSTAGHAFTLQPSTRTAATRRAVAARPSQPVKLSRDQLKSMSDVELVKHWHRPAVRDNPAASVAVLRELDRREQREQAPARRAQAAARRTASQRSARRSQQDTHRLYLENEWVNAENATRGTLVNKRGRAKGVDGRSLWTANSATRNAYASEELKSYWDKNPVRSAAEFAAFQRGDEQAVNRHNRARAHRQRYGVY